jgi:hypothetical protein
VVPGAVQKRPFPDDGDDVPGLSRRHAAYYAKLLSYLEETRAILRIIGARMRRQRAEATLWLLDQGERIVAIGNKKPRASGERARNLLSRAWAQLNFWSG